MKRATLIIFMFHLITLTYGQSDIGITAGINGSSLYGGGKKGLSKPDFTHTISHAASVFYKQAVTDRSVVGIELENIRVKSGIRMLLEEYYRYNSVYNAVFDLNYFNAHLFYGMRLFSVKKTTVSLTLGPYIGYLQQSKATGYYMQSGYNPNPGQQNTSYYEINEAPTDDVTKINLGFRLQLNAPITLTEKLFMPVNVSYNQGVSDVLYQAGYTGIVGWALTTGLAYRFNKNNKDENN